MDKVKRNPDTCVDDLHSEFDYQSEAERQKRKRLDLNDKEFSSFEKKAPRDEARAWFQDEHGRAHRQMSRMMTMDAYSRHKELINLYYLSHPGATKMLQRDTSKDRTDYDVLKDGGHVGKESNVYGILVHRTIISSFGAKLTRLLCQQVGRLEWRRNTTTNCSKSTVSSI